MLNLPNYVVVTPARNEAEFIELTLKSLVAQIFKPLRWVIVSDGSTDATDEIVSRYTAAHDWIELVHLPERRDRNFAGKVYAFNAGYERVKHLPYDAIVNVDGDISFEEDFFTFLMEKLAADSSLGVIGTAFLSPSNTTYDYRYVSIEHVTGCCQVFRRECFEAIGGYVPSKAGAVDSIAVISARMRGWKTRTFPQRSYQHHREFGTAKGGTWAARFGNGRKDYIIGNHPAWELFRAVRQMAQKPFLVGGLALACGYMWSLLQRVERPIPHDMLVFYRQEQMLRLRTFFKAAMGLRSPTRAALHNPR